MSTVDPTILSLGIGFLAIKLQLLVAICRLNDFSAHIDASITYYPDRA